MEWWFGSPIPRGLPLGPYFRGYFGGWTTCTKSWPPENYFIMCCERRVNFNPLITPLTLWIMSKRNTNIFRRKVTYSNLKDFKILPSENPTLCEGRDYGSIIIIMQCNTDILLIWYLCHGMPGASMPANFRETILAFLPAVCTARMRTQTGSVPTNLSAQVDTVSPTCLAISTISGSQPGHVSGTVAWNINCMKGVLSNISIW